MNTNKILLAAVALQSALIAGLVTGKELAPRATAQGIGNPGGQRQEAVDELKSLNAKMDKLMDLLESGKLQVRATLPDEKK